MYDHQDAVRPGRRADLPVAERDLDADLVRTVRMTSWMRQGFYVVVLLVAMAGQVTGAVEALHIPLLAAVPAVAALELGGIVVLSNADVRRRLGERAHASRLLSVAIAAWAVAFNWLAHDNHLLGGFYAGMSALGYLVWLMHTENQRRDRLRAKGDLPPTTPAYELWAHWLRHPLLTMRAKSLAKANPRLGLYDSMIAAREEVKRERRTSAISKVLHRKIRAAVDPTTADIAVAVYDLDKIAGRLADGADYAGLTALIAADLTPERLAVDAPTHERYSRRPVIEIEQQPVLAEEPEPEPEPVEEEPATAARPVLDPEMRRGIESIFSITREQPLVVPRVAQTAVAFEAPAPMAVPTTPAPGPAASAPGPSAPGPSAPGPSASPQAPASVSASASVPVSASVSVPMELSPNRANPAASAARASVAAAFDVAASDDVGGPEAMPAPRPNPSLRKRVHTALSEHVPADDERDNAQLLGFVGEILQLSDLERTTAINYVRSWRKDARQLAAQRG